MANNKSPNVVIKASNDFTAPIISEIGQMTSLKRISARKYIACLRSLDSFFYTAHNRYPPSLVLGYNEFDGSIPSEIGQLTSLTYLNFSEFYISYLCSLDSFYTAHNRCPPSLLVLDMNLLDGPIPREMGQLTSLTALHFCKYFEIFFVA